MMSAAMGIFPRDSRVKNKFKIAMVNERSVFEPLKFYYIVFAGFNMTADMLKSTEGTVLAYHRITEAFKFAYAKRTGLGDPKFIDIEQVNS